MPDNDEPGRSVILVNASPNDAKFEHEDPEFKLLGRVSSLEEISYSLRSSSMESIEKNLKINAEKLGATHVFGVTIIPSRLGEGGEKYIYGFGDAYKVMAKV